MADAAEGKAPMNPVVKWLGIATAIVVALAALLKGCKELADAYDLWKAKPVPTFPQYDSPEVGGGQTADTMCAGQRASYASANPDFDITIKEIPATINKDWKGHVTYIFHCQFIATPKSK